MTALCIAFGAGVVTGAGVGFVALAMFLAGKKADMNAAREGPRR